MILVRTVIRREICPGTRSLLKKTLVKQCGGIYKIKASNNFFLMKSYATFSCRQDYVTVVEKKTQPQHVFLRFGSIKNVN